MGAAPRPDRVRSRIAVVIRCHQQGRFLGEAVASVNAQSRRPDGIVVVNDGSTDETASVLAGLHDNPVPIHVVTRHPARGPVASLNDGIAAADADLILPLDADDRLSERFVEITAEALDTSRVSLAYGAVHEFGASTCQRPAAAFVLDDLLVENVAPVTTMFRRAMYEQLGPFDPMLEHLGLEDWEYWIRAAVAGFAGQPVAGCWLEYRRHGAASRNDLGRMGGLRARGRIWWKHRKVLRPKHVARWLATRR